MGKEDYDLICRTCVEIFNQAGAKIETKEHVEGGRCWRCLVRDSPSNLVYRLSIPEE